MSAPRFEADWDDRAQGWRVYHFDDEGEPHALPGPGRATGHPFFAATCAAALAARDGESDDKGLLWPASDDHDAETEARKAAEAATTSMSPLTKAEDGALKMIALLGMSTASQKTLTSLRAKHLLGEDGRATPAGKVRAGVIK